MNKSVRLIAWILLLSAFLVLSACSYFQTAEEEETYYEPAQTGQYLDFEDVRVPDDLSLVRDESFVYQNQAIRAGVLTFEGSMEVEDVINFFQTNMLRDGWVELTSFKSQKNILIYTKPDKVCLLIAVYPPPLNYMHLEVWVAPINPGANIPSAGGQWQSYQGVTGQSRTGTYPLGSTTEEDLLQ